MKNEDKVNEQKNLGLEGLEMATYFVEIASIFWMES